MGFNLFHLVGVDGETVKNWHSAAENNLFVVVDDDATVFVSTATPKNCKLTVQCGSAWPMPWACWLSRTPFRGAAASRMRESITHWGPNYEPRCSAATNWAIVHYTRKDTHTHTHTHTHDGRDCLVLSAWIIKRERNNFPFFYCMPVRWY